MTQRDDEKALQDVRVLIVEDEFLLALLLEEDLQSHGCITIGPYNDLASATEATRRETFDLAVLDINLNGRPVFPLADELLARGRPAVLLTGYGALDLPERFRLWPRVAKPYDLAVLVREIARVAAKSR